MDYINMSVVCYGMYDMSKMLQPESGKHVTLPNPVQYVCHTVDPISKKMTFITIDSFNSNHFELNPQLETYSDYQIFRGNTELHMQSLNTLADEEISNEEKHAEYTPFLKH